MDTTQLLVIGTGYACLNVLAFGAFARDKLKAKASTWRTPETTLLILAALGPFGAVAAMKVFRHKTRQVKFYLVPLFAVLHAVLIIWLWPRIFG
ncbi:MAG: DUF1294 domain-containing protein [Methanoregula sp.]|jgi:uncharacterized membrane protein YsdA (DUF1294 family)|nr:DUF1294 domain-containing protein [Methanoregula sp.]